MGRTRCVRTAVVRLSAAAFRARSHRCLRCGRYIARRGRTGRFPSYCPRDRRVVNATIRIRQAIDELTRARTQCGVAQLVAALSAIER